MIRSFLLLAFLITGARLRGQEPEQIFQTAWSRYAALKLESDPGDQSVADLGPEMDALGRAWATWMEKRGLNTDPMALPELSMVHAPKEPGERRAWMPSLHVIEKKGPWLLAGLEVPVPCGSHLYIALFKRKNHDWSLKLLDLRETAHEGDPLGARENAQALLLKGPRVAVASTPPWCTSCWSMLHVRVLAPGADSEHPRTLTRYEDGVYRCVDDGAFRMSPVKSGIRLRYKGQASDAQIATGQIIVGRRRLLRVP